MQCDTARHLLPFARSGPAELEAADRTALDAHLAECPDCATLFRAEAESDAALGHAMRDVPVPASLHKQLGKALDAARYAWWRVRLLGACASALALGLASGVVYRATRPTLDAFAIAKETYERAGLWRSEREARDSADDWLRRQDSRLTTPADLDYRLLAFVGRSDFSGLTSVPMVTLVRGEATARVYFVRAAALKGWGDAAEQPVEEGGCTVAVRRYEELPGWLVIVVTAGRPVEWFLRKPDAGGPA